MPSASSSLRLVTRSMYVARLRRAFILRAHPDKFRKHTTTIRQQQSVLLQSLSERMTQPDFQDYTLHRSRRRRHSNSGMELSSSVVHYVLEKRDTTLLHQTLDLTASVETILDSMASALELSGAAKLSPPLPSSSSSKSSKSKSTSNATHYEQESHHPHKSWQWVQQPSTTPGKTTSPHIDHRFDVNTNRGRNLQHFLATITPREMEDKRARRMDATAAALIARRLFAFQALDARPLQWSSQSYAELLGSLIQLYEEHRTKFHVTSFYPLQLVFAHHTPVRNSALDVYSGRLYINPAATHLEWLRALREVTQERLDAVRHHRHSMTHRITLLQHKLRGDNDATHTNTNTTSRSHGRDNIGTSTGIIPNNNNHNNYEIKIKKGFTCSSKEYHQFLERHTRDYHTTYNEEEPAALAAENDTKTKINTNDNTNNSTITIMTAFPLIPVIPSNTTTTASSPGLSSVRGVDPPLRLIVESPEAIASRRGATVTPQGQIQIPASIAPEQLDTAVRTLASRAQQRSAEEQRLRDACRSITQQVQTELGIAKIFRHQGGRVSHAEFIQSLSRILALHHNRNSSNTTMLWSGRIASLGIAIGSQACHLSDDGSVIIPHNWTWCNHTAQYIAETCMVRKLEFLLLLLLQSK